MELLVKHTGDWTGTFFGTHVLDIAGYHAEVEAIDLNVYRVRVWIGGPHHPDSLIHTGLVDVPSDGRADAEHVIREHASV